MKTALITFALLLALLLTGCVSSPVLKPPPEQSVRDQFGRIGVMVYTRSTGFKTQMPASKSQASGECAVLIGWEPLFHTEGDLRAMAMALAWLPVGLAAGGTYGAVKGESEQSLASGGAVLSAAYQEDQFEMRLAEALRHLAVEKTGNPLRTVPPSCRVEHYVTSDFSEVYFGNTYTNLATHEIDTVLELEVIHPALAGADGVNPRLAFGVEVKVRLLAAADNKLLYGDRLQYRSPKHSFAEWTVNNASRLQSEIQSSLAQISGEIVSQLFVRTTIENLPATSKLHRSSP